MYKSTRKKGSQRLKQQTTATRNNEVLLPCLSRAGFTSENSVLDTLHRTGEEGRLPPGAGGPGESAPPGLPLGQLWAPAPSACIIPAVGKFICASLLCHQPSVIYAQSPAVSQCPESDLQRHSPRQLCRRLDGNLRNVRLSRVETWVFTLMCECAYDSDRIRASPSPLLGTLLGLPASLPESLPQSKDGRPSCGTPQQGGHPSGSLPLSTPAHGPPGFSACQAPCYQRPLCLPFLLPECHLQISTSPLL